MDNNEKAIDSLLKGVEYMVDSKIKTSPMDRTTVGIVKKVNTDDTYDVQINRTTYGNVPSMFKGLAVGESVKVLIPQGQMNQIFILGKIGMEIGGTSEGDILPKPTDSNNILISNSDLQWQQIDVTETLPSYTLSEYEAKQEEIPTGQRFIISDDFVDGGLPIPTKSNNLLVSNSNKKWVQVDKSTIGGLPTPTAPNNMLIVNSNNQWVQLPKSDIIGNSPTNYTYEEKIVGNITYYNDNHILTTDTVYQRTFYIPRLIQSYFASPFTVDLCDKTSTPNLNGLKSVISITGGAFQRASVWNSYGIDTRLAYTLGSGLEVTLSYDPYGNLKIYATNRIFQDYPSLTGAGEFTIVVTIQYTK